MFNTTWRTNAQSSTTATSNPLQATGSADGRSISGAFIDSYGNRTPYTANRVSTSY